MVIGPTFSTCAGQPSSGCVSYRGLERYDRYILCAAEGDLATRSRPSSRTISAPTDQLAHHNGGDTHWMAQSQRPSLSAVSDYAEPNQVLFTLPAKSSGRRYHLECSILPFQSHSPSMYGMYGRESVPFATTT